MKKEATVLGFLVLGLLILTNFEGFNINKLTNKKYLQHKYKTAREVVENGWMKINK